MYRCANPLLPLPLLITGVPGVPGFNAIRYFQKRYPGQVFGIRQVENRHAMGPHVLGCNAEDVDALGRLFDQHQFAAVLDCSGNCALKPCELDPPLAWRINVQGARNLLDQIVPRGLRLVRLSVDLVYSGDRAGGYVEEDPPDPVTVYGKTMAAAEELITSTYPSAAILRISLPMGPSLSGHAGAIDWIVSRFKKSRPATLFFDEFRTPAYTDCLNELCEQMLANDLSGIYHAGGPRVLSLYQIAQIINRVGGYDPDCLMGMPRAQASPIPPRAGNVAMDSSKIARAIGYAPLDPWPLDDELVPTHRDWHREGRAGAPYSPAYLQQVLCTNRQRRTITA
jgi:dTDP-4-dehydrorhamnose reductase